MKYLQREGNAATNALSSSGAREGERERQRRVYEESLRLKRAQLRNEFEKIEEVRKSEAASVTTQSEVRFKQELDALVARNERQIGARQKLQIALSKLCAMNDFEEHLPPPAQPSHFLQAASLSTASLHADGSRLFAQSMFVTQKLRASSVQFLSAIKQREGDREELNEYLAYLKEEEVEVHVYLEG